MRENLFRGISIVLSILGLLLIVKSTSFGMDATNDFVRSNGGSVDTAQYLQHFESFTASYRLIGGILLGVGLFQALRR